MVSKRFYDEVVTENRKLKDENEGLRMKVEEMRREFLQMSELMNEIIHEKNAL